MKKLLTLTALALASSTLAQTWDAQDGKLTLIGCYGQPDGINCDFSYTLTRKQKKQPYFSIGNFRVVTRDGFTQGADAISFIDGKFYSSVSSVEVVANVPVKVQAYFNIPNSTTSFRSLLFDDVNLDNVPVRPLGPTLPVPAQLTAPISVGGYSISLSDCKLQGAEYVCTAKATPAR